MDIRWIQRFYNFTRALTQLGKFIQKQNLNELEEQGLIQSFEYNHELAWKTLKDLLISRGYTDIFGSKDTTREAFSLGLLGDTPDDGEIWMEMIKSRNLTSHTYDEEVTKKIVSSVINDFYPAFLILHEKLLKLANNEKK